MKEIIERLWEENARVERVILLAGALASEDDIPSDLDDFLDDEDDETIEKCLGKIPDWVSEKSMDRKIDIAQWLIETGRLGVLIQFATPIMTPLDEGAMSFSWGSYTTTWVYADTINEAIDKGLAWVKECRSNENEEAAGKGHKS
jgi:hypothetical protein